MVLDPSLIALGIATGLAAGAVAGTMAGLAGVGGGLIYVPVFFMLMPDGESGTLSLEVLGSLVAVFITGFFSARAHWRLGHVERGSLRLLLPGLLIGAGLGLWSTLQIPEALILISMAALDAWIAWDYGREVKSEGIKSIPLVPFSGPVGYISGVLGIGGGTMLVPILRRSLSLREAVGTSAACGMIMAGGAVALNLLFETAWHTLLKEQMMFLGGAWMGILLILPLTSGWAASLHTTLGEAQLRNILKATFILLSMVMFAAAVGSAV